MKSKKKEKEVLVVFYGFCWRGHGLFNFIKGGHLQNSGNPGLNVIVVNNDETFFGLFYVLVISYFELITNVY